ncbi:MAG: hypothetical protein OQJ95_06525 [Kangiella sp.]|nr:hypothetical protein [Kangiella sp.]MCW9029236.1 hypothetical protein [Kangiella sp.]
MSNQITEEQWEQVQEALQSTLSRCNFLIDGYKVGYVLRRVSNFQLGITCFVNDHFKGEWFVEPYSEEAQKFFVWTKKNLYSPSKVKEFQRKFGKKRAKEMGLDKYRMTPNFYTQSFNRLKKHLIEHNKSIELVEIL